MAQCLDVHTARGTNRTRMMYVLRRHRPEYLMEGADLGLFMISACVFVAILD